MVADETHCTVNHRGFLKSLLYIFRQEIGNANLERGFCGSFPVPHPLQPDVTGAYVTILCVHTKQFDGFSSKKKQSIVGVDRRQTSVRDPNKMPRIVSLRGGHSYT